MKLRENYENYKKKLEYEIQKNYKNKKEMKYDIEKSYKNLKNLNMKLKKIMKI